MTPYLISVTTIPTSSSTRPSEAQDCCPQEHSTQRKTGDEGKHRDENSLHQTQEVMKEIFFS